MEEPSIEFDELSRSTLEQILTRPISNMAWDQASLPTKMSGLINWESLKQMTFLKLLIYPLA